MIIKFHKWKTIAFKVDKVEDYNYHGVYVEIAPPQVNTEWPTVGIRDVIRIDKKDFKDNWITIKKGDSNEQKNVQGHGKDNDIHQQQDLEGFQAPLPRKKHKHNKRGK